MKQFALGEVLFKRFDEQLAAKGLIAKGGHVVRSIGLARARVKIALMNLAYNLRRFVLLCKREIQAPNGFDRRGACAVA